MLAKQKPKLKRGLGVKLEHDLLPPQLQRPQGYPEFFGGLLVGRAVRQQLQ
nr:hypothetical protein [Posidoniimonas corsicana]